MKKKIIKITFIVCSFLLAFFISANVAGLITYSSLSKRVKDIDYSITPGLVCYERIKDTLPRNEYTYKSKDETLCGYYYKNDDTSPLIVVSSGYNDVSDSLLAYHARFYELGYNVFSYDNSGTGKSSGTQKGFYQSLIDLESTLRFIDSVPELTNLPLLLFGYSAGGFASTAIFNIDDFDVLASVSISGYDDANKLMLDKGKEYAGFISYLGIPTINAITNHKFKDYMSYNAIDGINNTNIPFYIAHGYNDTTIPFNDNSIYKKQSEITNTDVVFSAFDDRNHVSILYNDNVFNYREAVNKELNKIIRYKKKQEYVKNVDHHRYSLINYKLVNDVHNLYQSVV